MKIRLLGERGALLKELHSISRRSRYSLLYGERLTDNYPERPNGRMRLRRESREEARPQRTPERYSGPPATLGNMRANGVRSLLVSCTTCAHSAVLNVDGPPRR